MRDPAEFMTSMMNVDWEHDGLHCWAMTRTMVYECFGVRVPLVASVIPTGRTAKAKVFNDHPERAKWREVEQPEQWAIALMSRKGAHPDFFEHSGVYVSIEGGGVFHVDHPHGCVFDSVMEIVQLRKWAQPRFFVPL